MFFALFSVDVVVVKIAVVVVVVAFLVVEQLLTLQQNAALTHDYRLSRAERGRP